MRSSTTVQHATPEQRSHSRRTSNRREQILRTTAHLFLERGFETTSMADIAAASNISKPGLTPVPMQQTQKRRAA